MREDQTGLLVESEGSEDEAGRPGWYPPISIDEEGFPVMATAKGGRPTEGKTKLQAILDERGLTQEEVAGLTGVSKNTIGEVCRGSQVPHPGLIKRLREQLGVPYEDLVDWDDYDTALEAEVEKKRKAWKSRKRKAPTSNAPE